MSFVIKWLILVLFIWLLPLPVHSSISDEDIILFEGSPNTVERIILFDGLTNSDERVILFDSLINPTDKIVFNIIRTEPWKVSATPPKNYFPYIVICYLINVVAVAVIFTRLAYKNQWLSVGFDDYFYRIELSLCGFIVGLVWPAVLILFLPLFIIKILAFDLPDFHKNA